ncbi:relaxase domain-containing protein [Acidithiobacillus ferrooxidans F221]|uniref:MobF family relaxase n=1 Tax=Acidithiobacillus ferrooxidans TaxID=920 RepID=UPI001C06A6FC|nr:MobF family relaxase [Acidithiobacillus ferrooxidans]MBU2807582.1 relaxase domain-containing protein [Acidithiobacillus ferrooxidans F221]
MIRNTHLSGSSVAVAKYMQNTHEEHLTRSGEAKATGYYSMSGGAPSEWFGKGAEAQGLIGAVSAEDMVRALSGTVKHTGEDISTRGGQTAETRRMGEELTIAAPKSVSIMAVEDPRLVQAHQRAARAAMRYVEQEMVYARIGKGGGKGNDFSGNLTAGLYTHEDARDSATGRVAPHLHSHAIIANMIQRTDGKWAGLKLDWGHNNQKKLTADAVYKAELAREVKAFGYQIEKGKGADFEIAGITREQIEYFSPRSQDIKNEIGGERDGVSAKERQAAQNKTKGNKSSLNQIDQRYAWRREFREQNMDLQAIHANAARREAAGIPVSQITAEDAVKSAVRHLSERDSVFSEQSLKSEALSAGLGDVSPEAIDAAIKARAGGLVYAGQAEGLNDCQFTTKTAIFMEAEILHRGKEGRGKAEALYAVQSVQQEPLEVITLNNKELQDGKRSYDNPVNNVEATGTLSANSLRELSQCSLDANQTGEDSSVLHGDEGLDRSGNSDLRRAGDDPRINAIIAAQEGTQGFRFSDGQKAAVELALTSQDRHFGVVGSSGAGKTTSMKVIVKEYQQAGYTVIGVAPTSKAKRELESANCNETITLADALLRKPSLDESGQPTQKILYVMDEAGMVSSKDFDRFYKRADLENARTLVVGDPYQIESVEAGTPFAQLLETGSISHVKIDEVQRQRAAPELLKIAQAFASGDAKKGVELAKPFMTQVHVEKGQDKDEALAKVAASRYMAMSPQQRADTYFIADTNKKKQAINAHVREGLTAAGALGGDTVRITALDKLDLTKESATKSENYVSKDGTAQVVVEFHRDYADKNTGVGAEKGSQWSVVDTSGGKLTLQDRNDPAKKLQVNPVKITVAAFTSREMELRTGDQVYFRQNDKTRDIINGTAGTVTVENGKASVNTDHGQTIPLTMGRGEVLDYSYAITTHASQGGTKHTAIPVLTGGGRGMNANLAYVAMTRETHSLEIITDDVEKLGKSICKFSEKQSAIEASETQVLPEMEEIRQARRAADYELGQAGDLAEKRSQEQEQKQEHIGEQEPEVGIAERKEYQFSAEPEHELELGD